MSASAQAKCAHDAEVPEHLQILEGAVCAVENDEVFQRWLDFRSRFHNYSWGNVLMILFQRPDATLVAGYQSWRKNHGRQVKRGEKGITILAPIIVRRKETDVSTGKERKRSRLIGFRGARVFDVAQTEGEPIPEQPPSEKLSGDSHASYLAQLVAHAGELGYKVDFRDDLVGCEGYCHPLLKVIAVNNAAPANAQVRILIHELVHAHGTSYTKFGRQLAETITDSATFVACRSIGLDATKVVAQYVAGWSDPEIRQRALAYIDYYAAAIERALGVHDRTPSLPAEPAEESDSKAAA